MNPLSIFINPHTNLLRSGWRVLVFVFVVMLPYWIIGLFLSSGSQPADSDAAAQFEFNVEQALTYVILDIWLLFASWLCLWLLERLNFGALGYAFYRGWWRDVLLGCGIAALMIVAVVVIQMLSGGTRLMLSPMFWKEVDGARTMDWTGALLVLGSSAKILALFIVAAAFEELLCRGYAFQTLLRGVPAIVPILLLSLIFGLLHLGNPNTSVFAIANTVLAGVWLSVAYLKTRNLWFPTALHFMWNWMMGSFFGLPVSGLKTGAGSSFFLATSEAPVWLTGGSYGCEGGAAVTIVVLIGTVLLWRAPLRSASSTDGSLPAAINLFAVERQLATDNEPRTVI